MGKAFRRRADFSQDLSYPKASGAQPVLSGPRIHAGGGAQHNSNREGDQLLLRGNPSPREFGLW